jgi:hypothetical protein
MLGSFRTWITLTHLHEQFLYALWLWEWLFFQYLCKAYPSEFASYFHYCRSLRFDDKPDYSYLKRIFRDLFIREGMWINTLNGILVICFDLLKKSSSQVLCGTSSLVTTVMTCLLFHIYIFSSLFPLSISWHHGWVSVTSGTVAETQYRDHT